MGWAFGVCLRRQMTEKKQPYGLSSFRRSSKRRERYKHYKHRDAERHSFLYTRLSPENSRAVAIINRRPAVTYSTERYIFYPVYEAVDVRWTMGSCWPHAAHYRCSDLQWFFWSQLATRDHCLTSAQLEILVYVHRTVLALIRGCRSLLTVLGHVSDLCIILFNI